MKATHACIIGLAALAATATARGYAQGESVERLRTLGRNCLYYAMDNNGTLPPDLASLHYRAYVNRVRSFTAPDRESVMTRDRIDKESDYVLSYRAQLSPAEAGDPDEASPSPAPPSLPAASAPAIPVIRDRTAANNGGAGIYIFYSDGTIRRAPATDVPAVRPTGERPTQERPTRERPQGERPAPERPTGERPTPERPTADRPVAERPTRERPEVKRPRPGQVDFKEFSEDEANAYREWLKQQQAAPTNSP